MELFKPQDHADITDLFWYIKREDSLGYKTRPVRVGYKTMTLATRITIGRILMIPFFIGALLYYQKSARDGVPEEGYRWAATFIFFLAAVSDAVDGIIARRWNQRSRLGAILDPWPTRRSC
jgi:phosphatidylglycerophosphate synthase